MTTWRRSRFDLYFVEMLEGVLCGAVRSQASSEGSGGAPSLSSVAELVGGCGTTGGSRDSSPRASRRACPTSAGTRCDGRRRLARSKKVCRRVALASAALAFCLPASWVAGASAAVACLTAATGRRLGVSARLGVADSGQRNSPGLNAQPGELPHALARGMAHATRLNARLASRKCDRPRSRQSTA